MSVLAFAEMRSGAKIADLYDAINGYEQICWFNICVMGEIGEGRGRVSDECQKGRAYMRWK